MTLDLKFLSINRRERTIFEGVLRLLDTVTKTVDLFEASVSAFADGDAKSSEIVE